MQVVAIFDLTFYISVYQSNIMLLVHSTRNSSNILKFRDTDRLNPTSLLTVQLDTKFTITYRATQIIGRMTGTPEITKMENFAQVVNGKKVVNPNLAGGRG